MTPTLVKVAQMITRMTLLYSKQYDNDIKMALRHVKMAYIILIVRHLYLKKWYKMIHFSLVLVKWKQTHENDTDFHTTPLLLKNTKNGKLQVFTKDKGINEWWVKYERRNNRKMVFTIRKGSTIRKSHMWTSIYRVRFLWGPPLWCEPPSNVDDQVF